MTWNRQAARMVYLFVGYCSFCSKDLYGAFAPIHSAAEADGPPSVTSYGLCQLPHRSEGYLF